MLNSFPYTCFAENVGLVRLTRIKSRYVVAAAGVFMILIGLIPKAGALVASIPPPVLGGAAIAMFATVAVVGIQTLARVDFHDHRNVVIVGTSIGLAMFVTAQPDVAEAVPDWAQIIFGSGITLGSLCAILLNLVFHHVGKNFGPAVAGTPGTGVIRLDQVNEMSRETVRGDLRPAVPGADLGGRTGLRPAAVHRHPRPADGVPGGAVLRRPHRAARPAELLPGPGQRRRRRRRTAARNRERDQASAGLTLLNDEDHEEFAQLTQAYRERFGIPLIVSVRDVEKRDQILKSGWERMQNSPTQEHAAAIIEVAKIANHRFDDLVADASPILLAPGRPAWRRSPQDLRPGPPAAGRRGRLATGACGGSTQLSDAEARATLRSCLDVPRWVDEVAEGRPYATAPVGAAPRPAGRGTASPTTRSTRRWPGTRGSASRPAPDHDAEFSAAEQAAVGDADPAVTEAIRAGNAEYESRFDRVFLIRAAGRPADEILAELRRRLDNTPEDERAEVVTQLREIALTRLETVLA